jgi:hypothetical protein
MDRNRFATEIRFEIDQLLRLAITVNDLLEVIKGQPLPWHAAAGAKYVADLWLGFENLCKRRCVYLGLPIPSGADSHNRLLEDFLAEPELGGKLSADIQYRLKKYKNFRHRFIHGYGFEINWENVNEPLHLLPETVALLSSLWLAWLDDASH